MFRLRLFCRLFFFALFLFQWYPAEAAKRETRTLVLKNGLEALLIHDPEVHRSAAALSVGVGSLYDPEEKMGLTHYLEHMLFLGTKKYPDVGSYQKYLNANSGRSNAYTGDVVTNYFFEGILTNSNPFEHLDVRNNEFEDPCVFLFTFFGQSNVDFERGKVRVTVSASGG